MNNCPHNFSWHRLSKNFIELFSLLLISQSTLAAVLDAGGYQICGILPDDTLLCWGDKDELAPKGTFSQISVGAFHDCGIKTDNSLGCWAPDWFDFGQVTPPKGTFSQVSVGYYHTCGVKTDQTVACWGNNDYGQATPPPNEIFLQVSAGRWHSCGVKTDKSVACWGSNTNPYAEKGENEHQATPPSGTFSQVSAAMGGWHTCGVRTDQTVACWGSDNHGQASPPKGTFLQVSTGKWHTCGLRTDQTITCWGSDSDGQATPPIGTFSLVTAGIFETCGVRTNDTVDCWGTNSDGRFNAIGSIVKSSPLSNDCFVHGVYNFDSNKSQFFTLDPNTLQFSLLGDTHRRLYFQALDVHPLTNQLYAAQGGSFYKIHPRTLLVTELGKIDLKQVEGLTFHPEGTLWGWASDAGLFQLQNNRKDEPMLNKVKVVFPYPQEAVAEEEMEEQLEVKVTDLTWNTAGTTLYGVGKLSSWPLDSDKKSTNEEDTPTPPNWEVGQLWFYNPEENAVGTVCDKLMNSLTEVEALETRPEDDALLLGFHEKGKILLKMIDVKTCEVIEEKEISTEFSDIKGLAWPKNCNSIN